MHSEFIDDPLFRLARSSRRGGETGDAGMRWFMDVSYPVMKAMRSQQAVEAAREPATRMDFDELRNLRQAIVVTYRRSGEPMPTPVNHAVSDDGKLYFRSEPHVGKMKRIRNNPRVLVVPCTFRGKPRGAAAEGIARELSGAEAERAFELINSNWGAVMRPCERGLDLLGVPEVYVEVVPVAHVADSEPRIYDDSDPPLAPRTPSM